MSTPDPGVQKDTVQEPTTGTGVQKDTVQEPPPAVPGVQKD
jgi:hypothetical protein